MTGKGGKEGRMDLVWSSVAISFVLSFLLPLGQTDGRDNTPASLKYDDDSYRRKQWTKIDSLYFTVKHNVKKQTNKE